jgi:hypothetical protein
MRLRKHLNRCSGRRGATYGDQNACESVSFVNLTILSDGPEANVKISEREPVRNGQGPGVNLIYAR